jgi:hypothetical protein
MIMGALKSGLDVDVRLSDSRHDGAQVTFISFDEAAELTEG